MDATLVEKLVQERLENALREAVIVDLHVAHGGDTDDYMKALTEECLRRGVNVSGIREETDWQVAQNRALYEATKDCSIEERTEWVEAYIKRIAESEGR